MSTDNKPMLKKKVQKWRKVSAEELGMTKSSERKWDYERRIPGIDKSSKILESSSEYVPREYHTPRYVPRPHFKSKYSTSPFNRKVAHPDESSTILSKVGITRDEYKRIEDILVDGKIKLDKGGWSILDHAEGTDLYLTHYTEGETFDHMKTGNNRGVIFDVKNETKVAQSHGFTPSVLCDKIQTDKDGNLTMIDEYGIDHNYKAGKFRIHTGHEGVVLRAFKHNGIFYLSSHKRIKPYNSRWGPSRRFIDMYKSLGGPKPEDLFHKDTLYSPFCYIFLVVDPCLLIGSKEEVGEGYILYLGVMKMWSLDGDSCPYKGKMGLIEGEPRELKTIPYPMTKIDSTDGCSVIPRSEYPKELRPASRYKRDKDSVAEDDPFGGDWKAKTIYDLEPLSIAQANYHLSYGYYPPYDPLDARLRLGEFLLIMSDADDSEPDTIKVESTAYRHRTILRDDRYNSEHRMFELIGDSFPGNDLEFERKYPILPLVSSGSLAKHLEKGYLFALAPDKSDKSSNMVTYVTGKDMDLTERDIKICQIWANFILSMPPQQQCEMKDFHAMLDRSYREVTAFIMQIVEGKIDPKKFLERRFPIRATIIANRSRNHVRIHSRSGVTHYSYIHTALRQERGSSLYNMWRFSKECCK